MIFYTKCANIVKEPYFHCKAFKTQIPEFFGHKTRDPIDFDKDVVTNQHNLMFKKRSCFETGFRMEGEEGG